jgi:hypothetical protein
MKQLVWAVKGGPQGELMPEDTRDILAVLKSELHFLENGGYKQSPRMQRRPPFIFEDSPTCLNYGSEQRLLPCSECVLMAFVPQDCRGERIPCRHISLNVEGYTIDTYYRLGTQEELEVDVDGWLRKTIQRLKGEGEQQQGEGRALISSYTTARE